MEAVVETAKRFQEFEQRYQANQASFERIQVEFRQMQDGTVQLQSLAEERLAALANLNVELKARHSQGEQTLAEVRALQEEIKASGAERRLDADRAGQLVQTQAVLEALMGKIQERQAQLEQSLVATQALIEDQGKQGAARDEALAGVRGLTEGIRDRQESLDKAVAALHGAQQAEKGLMAHFEKSLNTVRTMVVEIERRQGQTELNVAAIKAMGGDATAVNQHAVGAVAELMNDIGERQSAMLAQIEEIRQTANQNGKATASDAAAVKQQAAGAVAEAMKDVGERHSVMLAQIEEIRHTANQSAEKAGQALEKAAQASVNGTAAVVAVAPGSPQEAIDFQQFSKRCDADHKQALERESKLQTQWRKAVEAFPSRAEAVVQKHLEQSQGRMDQAVTGWLQQREQRVGELDKRFDSMLSKVVEKHRQLEAQMSTLAAGSQPGAGAPPPEWMEAVEAANATHGSELRFIKTLLWITLAAVGLSYALVAYALILRSS